MRESIDSRAGLAIDFPFDIGRLVGGALYTETPIGSGFTEQRSNDGPDWGAERTLMALTVTSALRWWAKEIPDALAIKVEDRGYTYSQLDQLTREVAAGLAAKGVAAGDRICVLASNSLDYCVLMLSALHIGAILAPLNFRLTTAEVVSALGDFAPVAVFADAARRETARAAVAAHADIPVFDVNGLESLRGHPGGLRHTPQAADPVVIISTSGSTARPKGVVLTHYSMVIHACEFTLMDPRCGRGSRLLLVTPLSAASGYTLVLQYITSGVSIFMEPGFDPERALDLLVREKINIFPGVPTFFERIAALPQFETADLSSLYYSQVGGAAVSDELLRAWWKKGVVVRHLYGQTEAGGGWAARDDTALAQRQKCGRGGLFNEVAVLGTEGFCPPGVVGEIVIRGPSRMIGYWNNTAATDEALKDDWIHTGDMGSLDEDGNVTFSHRKKDIIISGGLNISCAEIEQAIRELNGVEQVAVVPTPDAAFGETPLAVVYAPSGKLNAEAIIGHCNQRLANFKVPRYVVIESQPLPLLHTGKIAKPALKELYKDAAHRLQRVR